jgi:hypothetical protein
METVPWATVPPVGRVWALDCGIARDVMSAKAELDARMS